MVSAGCVGDGMAVRDGGKREVEQVLCLLPFNGGLSSAVWVLYGWLVGWVAAALINQLSDPATTSHHTITSHFSQPHSLTFARSSSSSSTCQIRPLPTRNIVVCPVESCIVPLAITFPPLHHCLSLTVASSPHQLSAARHLTLHTASLYAHIS